MRIKLMGGGALLAVLLAVPITSSADALSIVNGSFESGADGSAGAPGWTDSDPINPGFWTVADNDPGSAPDPTEASDGSLFLYANRLAGGAGSQPSESTLSQVVTLSAANLLLVQAGGATISLDFDYFDSDENDPAEVSLTFLDNTASELGFLSTGVLPEYANGTTYDAVTAPWQSANLNGAIDSATTAVRIDINTGPRAGGSATNLSFDNFTGSVIPEPATISLIGFFGAGALFIRRRLML